jgi:hypothetical protein
MVGCGGSAGDVHDLADGCAVLGEVDHDAAGPAGPRRLSPDQLVAHTFAALAFLLAVLAVRSTTEPV